MKAILGKKIGMTQIYDAEGRIVPVTVLQVLPMSILQVKTPEKHGYWAVQAGTGELKMPAKSQKAFPFAMIREFRIDESESGAFQTGTRLDVSLFQVGEQVVVKGVSKGKGFQGGVKRHGFAGRNATHGVKHEQRTIGSVGGRFPQRVVKGRKMPGQTGGHQVTVRNLKVAHVDAEKGLLAVEGALPGGPGALLEIRGNAMSV